MDEMGFLMEICNTKRRIRSKHALNSKKMLGAAQDGSREFISLIACICADGTALPPALIYAGMSQDLQDTWLENFDTSTHQAYFAVSERGWTNDELEVSWLETVFIPKTSTKAGLHSLLLIVDGHSSHVNWRFIDIYDQNRIILGVQTPHATHRLQPLDLKIFSPLSTAYSNAIDTYIQRSEGFSRLSKGSFWSLFKPIWSTALHESQY